MRLAVLLALLLVPAVATADPDHPGVSSEVGAGAAAIVISYQGKTTIDPGLAFRFAFGRYVAPELITSLELSDTIFLHSLGTAYEVENAFQFGIGAQLRVHRAMFVGAGVGLTRGSIGPDLQAISLNGWDASARVSYVLSREDASVRTLSLAFTHAWLASGPGSINAVAVMFGVQFL